MKAREKQRRKTGTMIGEHGARRERNSGEQDFGAKRSVKSQRDIVPSTDGGQVTSPYKLDEPAVLTRECYFHPSAAGIRITR